MSVEFIRSIGSDPPALSTEEKMLLGLGTKFIGLDKLTTPEDPGQDATRQAAQFETLIQRRVFFGIKDQDLESSQVRPIWMPKSSFKPSTTEHWEPINDTLRIVSIDIADAESNRLLRQFYNKKEPIQPLPDCFKRGLHSLKRRIVNGEIIVTLCDKNLGFVVLSKQTYIKALLEHLSDKSTYEMVGLDTNENRLAFKEKYLNELEALTSRLEKGIRNKLQFATRKTTKDTQMFKVIIKIHKMSGNFSTLKTRPITPAVGFYTSILSRYISDFLVLALPMVRSYVRDATDAAQKLIAVDCGNIELFSVTGDIPSMFTNVPMDRNNIALVIDYVIHLIRKNTPEAAKSWPSKDFLIDAIALVCKYNIISGPEGRLYLQIEGLAMGTSLAAAFASLAIGAREEIFLSIYDRHFLTWLRFADDIYALSDKNSVVLQDTILKHFCADVPELNKVPWTIVNASTDAVFLDARVSLCNSRITGVNLLVTSLYQKELNRYQYLPYYSCHLSHMIRSWVASETQRYARLCFHKHDFIEVITLFKARLKARGYPQHVIDEEINKVDYVLVQHDTLHLKVKLPDCTLCRVQAAAHPKPQFLTGSMPSAYPTSESTPSAKIAKRNRNEDVVESKRYLTLTAIQPLVDHRKELTSLLSRGIHRAESLVQLPPSSIQIAWKTPKNLSSILTDSNRKSLLKR